MSSTYSMTSIQLFATKAVWNAISDDFCGSGISCRTWLRTSAASWVTWWSSQCERDLWYRVAKFVARSTSPLLACTISKKCSSTSAFCAWRSSIAFCCLSASTATSASTQETRRARCSAWSICGLFRVTLQSAISRVSMSYRMPPLMLRKASAEVTSSKAPRVRTSELVSARPCCTAWRMRGMSARTADEPPLSFPMVPVAPAFCSNARPCIFIVPQKPR
mmetsp:Transcript_26093/g.66484  ORF Transcript_26093/g.66484 Transcript_26093/m.66484 type:complete len:220 (+) Transcript_26093:949-1608(+)